MTFFKESKAQVHLWWVSMITLMSIHSRLLLVIPAPGVHDGALALRWGGKAGIKVFEISDLYSAHTTDIKVSHVFDIKRTGSQP